MALAAEIDVDLDPDALDTDALGEALITYANRLAQMECQWLMMLRTFDRRLGWAYDGQLSCVDWLVWKCGFSRKAAYDRRRVANELFDRPLIEAAFAAGELSYSKVRAITRITGADEETDRCLLKLAEAGTAADLDKTVRRYVDLRDQDRGVEDYHARYDRRSTHISRTYDGMMVIEHVVPVEEGEEYLALVEAASDSPAGESSTTRCRTDAAMVLARAGRANLDKPVHVDRYTLHVVADLDALTKETGRAELIDGTPIAIETLRRIACDCAIVRHLVRGTSEPLDIGTRTSVWTTAQRRAITVRDRGHCRWPGCQRRICDAHHLVHVGDGGPTAVHNGCLLCPRHHTSVHEGHFSIGGEPNGELGFYRPDGSYLGSTNCADTQAAGPWSRPSGSRANGRVTR